MNNRNSLIFLLKVVLISFVLVLLGSDTVDDIQRGHSASALMTAGLMGYFVMALALTALDFFSERTFSWRPLCTIAMHLYAAVIILIIIAGAVFQESFGEDKLFMAIVIVFAAVFFIYLVSEVRKLWKTYRRNLSSEGD